MVVGRTGFHSLYHRESYGFKKDVGKVFLELDSNLQLAFHRYREIKVALTSLMNYDLHLISLI